MPRPHSLQNWNCLHCGELVPPNFGRCWNCGADRDGFPDPRFVPQRDEMPSPPPRASWSRQAMGLVLFMTAAGSLVVAAGYVDRWLPPAWSRRVAGIVILLLAGLCAAVAVNLAARIYPLISYYIGPGELEQKPSPSDRPDSHTEPDNGRTEKSP